MFSSIIRVAARVGTPFLLVAEFSSVVQVRCVLFIHLPADGHLNCSCFLAVMRNAAVNIPVQAMGGMRHCSWICTSEWNC